MRVAAIDQGTTSTRVLVVDGERAEIAASFAHRTEYPVEGWVEQDPLELLANIRKCIAAAGPVDAIGLANQGESCLAWDAVTGEPLTPVIVWQDSRTAGMLPTLDAARVKALSGLPLDPYFSASKLGWILLEKYAAREAWRQGRLRLGTTDAFFLDRLTGVFATDRATASRTSLMNIATGQWDQQLCDIFGLPIEALPEIRPNVSEFGRIDGVPVRASIVDQQAALYGHGCREAGDTKITFGTGAFALTVTGSRPAAAEGILPTVAWDLGRGPTYALDGGVYDVGSAIDWAIRTGIAGSLDDFQLFDAAPAIHRGLVFVPAFSGLAAPYWDRSAAPLILGMQPTTTRRDLCQALLEGIALSTAAVIEAMAEAVPLSTPIAVDGGVSRSPYFAKFLASCLERDVLVRGFAERTALGVALLAGAEYEPAGDTLVRPAFPIAAEHRRRFAEAQQRARGWR